MNDASAESVVQSQLTPDEKIHWIGHPDSAKIFTSSDILMIPFSLMWGGFAIFWEYSVLSMHTKVSNASGPLSLIPYIFPLWGIPFVCVGLYMIFGRFFYKAWIKGKTTYAITNKRVLIVTQGFSQQVQAQFFNQIPTINKNVRSDGTGTLTFGNLGFGGSMYANSGMGFFGSRYYQNVLAFYDVPDAEGVYQLVNKLYSEK